MNDSPHPDATPVAAALEHLTGPSRGSVMWLNTAEIDVSLSGSHVLNFCEEQSDPACREPIAHLHRTEHTYTVSAPAGKPVWVNGVLVTAKKLQHGDMIEFGPAGPVSRFRLYGVGRPGRKMVTDIVGDSLAYLRVSRQPVFRRSLRALGGLIWQLVYETTMLFRVTTLVTIVALAALAWQQYRLTTQLQQVVETGTARLDDIAAALARTRNEALRPGDLAAIREELGQRLTSNIDRLEALERRTGASARVITGAASSVAFIQGAFGFRERATGRMLRHVVNDAGVPFVSPRGQPLLSLDGTGPVAELQVIGTGFFIGARGALVTNRHVALPWENSAAMEAFATGDIEPVMIKMIAYLPGQAEAFPVTLRHASDTADLAVLSSEAKMTIKGLKLADAEPGAGVEVIVMGYPTGLRSMLAQSGPAFLAALEAAGDMDFWTIAARLAAGGHIAPLASRGIIGQATSAVIVYDAETTHGGSGGPVLDMEGRVVAVNTAILPEYGGSNLGVPAAKVRALLRDAGLE